MKKQLTLILIIIVAIVAGGVYGILHDQLTYTISPEYYTKFKFYQFRIATDGGNEAIFPNPRIQVAQVGFMATWWMGMAIGFILGVVGMLYKTPKQMFATTLRAFSITMAVAFTTGLLGLLYAQLFLANSTVDDFPHWRFPDNLTDFRAFVKVGTMHNFSYLGGAIGLVAGIVYSIKQRKYNTDN